MELLLNLLWSLLVVPAYWVWRKRDDPTSASLRALLTLGCGLVLLFPVISATDDLRAMQQESEESAAFKRSLRVAGISPDSDHKQFGNSPAHLVNAFLLPLPERVLEQVPRLQDSPAISSPCQAPSGRAPPFLCLG
jgi:hypothetical protein